MFKGIQMVAGGIGAVSLLVAALGITNTMIMSIYERTKEIGIMKVIGAILTDIKDVFNRSRNDHFLGGLAGILISLLISFLLNHFGSGGLLGNFLDCPKKGVKPMCRLYPAFRSSFNLQQPHRNDCRLLPGSKSYETPALSAIKTE